MWLLQRIVSCSITRKHTCYFVNAECQGFLRIGCVADQRQGSLETWSMITPCPVALPVAQNGQTSCNPTSRCH